jgi:hypothetical protein
MLKALGKTKQTTKTEQHLSFDHAFCVRGKVKHVYLPYQVVDHHSSSLTKKVQLSQFFALF